MYGVVARDIPHQYEEGQFLLPIVAVAEYYCKSTSEKKLVLPRRGFLTYVFLVFFASVFLLNKKNVYIAMGSEESVSHQFLEPGLEML